MITLKEACEIAQNESNNMRLIHCYDCGESYGFVAVSRSWKGGSAFSNDFPVGNNAFFVMKSDGRILRYPIMQAAEKLYKATEIGIDNFMSEEDKRFIKNYLP